MDKQELKMTDQHAFYLHEDLKAFVRNELV